jgi:hypothetical protein
MVGRAGETGSNDTDGDGLDDETEHDGWTVQTINRSGSAYQWAGPNRDDNGTIHAESDPKVTDSDYDGFSDAEEKRRIHTDPSGDVEYGIAFTIDQLTISRYVTNAADISRDDLFLGRYYFVSDDDEDGIIDEMEEKYGVPTRTEDGYERLYLDPSSPDSDGDGLLDGEEFESEREFQAGPLSPFERYVSYPLKSNPKRVDSDGDGLVDLAEKRLGFDPHDFFAPPASS